MPSRWQPVYASLMTPIIMTMTICESLGEALPVRIVRTERKPIAQRSSEGRFILSATDYEIASSWRWQRHSSQCQENNGGEQCTKLIPVANYELPMHPSA